MPVIVAISSPPGGGKTTLSERLLRHLPGAAVINYDDYQQVTEKSMDEIVAWLDRGGPLDFIEVPLLVEHLGRLKAGEAVTNPVTGAIIQPVPIILFETPLGRAHVATGQFIDLLIWIEVPLDLALARKLQLFTDEFLHRRGNGLVEEMNWLNGYLKHYQQGTYRALALQRERVRGERVDCHLDGLQNIDDLIRQAIECIGNRTAE